MDDLEKLKLDAREGRIDAGRLVDLLVTSQRQLEAANLQLEAAKREIEELKKQLGGAVTAKLEQPYSMRAEEQRQEARGQKKKSKRK